MKSYVGPTYVLVLLSNNSVYMMHILKYITFVYTYIHKKYKRKENCNDILLMISKQICILVLWTSPCLTVVTMIKSYIMDMNKTFTTKYVTMMSGEIF